MNCWQHLNISKTKDVSIIEQAFYQQKLAVEIGAEYDLLQAAYDEAIQYAESDEQPEQDVVHSFEQRVDSMPITPTSAAPVSQKVSQTRNSNSWSLLLLWGLALVGLYYIVVSIFPVQESPAQNKPVLKSTDWFEQLSDCEALSELTKNEQFERCVALAKKGSVRAQKKVAWLYFESDTKEDMQESFDWFNLAGKQDAKARLFSNILLLLKGNTPEDKQSGFDRIVKMTSQGDALAEAYLAIVYYLNLNPSPRTVNQTWLMEKAYDRNQGAVSVYDLARVYYNGFDTPTNITKAKQLLLDYAQQEFPDSANDIAWMFATLKNTDFVEPEVPLKLAKSVVDDPEYSDNYAYVDTLAAAYANSGDFEQAVEVQKRAVELLEQATLPEEEALELKDSFQERLNKYLSQEPERIFNLQIPRKNFFEAIKSEIEGKLINDFEFAAHRPEN